MTQESKASVLVDNCVDGLSDVMEPSVKETPIQWGDRQETVNIAGIRRRDSRSPDEVWLIKQIECLPTVARLAREGLLKLHTYDEIRFEGWKRPGGFPHFSLGNLFNGVEFTDVPPAVERSRLFQMEIGAYLEKEVMIEFCKLLLHADINSLLDKPVLREHFPEFEIQNLRNAGRFRELCESLAEKQYPDAFHLWTGEVNGIDYFLTTDGKFIRVMTETKRMDLPCKPISPEMLLADFNVKSLDPMPFQPNQFYTIFGNPE